MTSDHDVRIDAFLFDALELCCDPTGRSPHCEIHERGDVAGYLVARDHSVVDVIGGRVEFDLAGTDSARVRLRSGFAGGLTSSVNAVVELEGGEVEEELLVAGGGRLHWSGGRVGGVLRLVSPQSLVHVYGTGLGFGPERTIWGRLADGTPLAPKRFELLLGARAHQIILHDVETGDCEPTPRGVATRTMSLAPGA